jgi:hypothetical protein
MFPQWDSQFPVATRREHSITNHHWHEKPHLLPENGRMGANPIWAKPKFFELIFLIFEQTKAQLQYEVLSWTFGLNRLHPQQPLYSSTWDPP